MIQRLNQRRAIATLTAIVVLGFAFFLGISACTNCSQLLQLSTADSQGEMARQAAEGGVNDAMAQLRLNRAWLPNASYNGKPLPSTRTSSYTLTVTNNSSGSAPVVASDGTSVPAGLVYVQSKGTCLRATRQVDVMLNVDSSLNPFTYAIFGTSTQELEIENGARISAYSSTGGTGDYPANVGSNGSIEVQSGSRVAGNVASAGNVTISNGGAVTGTVTQGKDAVTFPPVTVSPPAGTTVTSLVVSNGQSVTLAPGTYYYSSLTVSGGGNLNISAGPVIIYLTGPLTVNNGGRINNNTQVPSNFQVYSSSTSSTAVTLAGGSDFYGAIYAPTGGFTISNGGSLYGSVVASTLDIQGGARVAYDVNLATITTPFSNASPSVTVLSWDRH